MDALEMIPLGSKRAGMIAVGSAACVSLLACSAVLALAALRQRTPRAASFLSTQVGVLLLNLVVADAMQSAGFALSLHWARLGALTVPGSPSPLCTTQSVLIQAGDVASALWTLVLAIHTSIILGLRRKPSTTAVVVTIAFVWTLVAFLTAIGPLGIAHGQAAPFYDQTGAWCWIGDSYEASRFWLHYFIILVTATTVVIIYPLLALRLRRQREGSVPDVVAYKMLAYPPAYLLLVLPIAIYRIAGIVQGRSFSFTFLAVAGTIYTLSGAVNALVFLGTRRGLFKRVIASPKLASLGDLVVAYQVSFANTKQFSKTATAYHAEEAASGRPSTARSWFDAALDRPEFKVPDISTMPQSRAGVPQLPRLRLGELSLQFAALNEREAVSEAAL